MLAPLWAFTFLQHVLLLVDGLADSQVTAAGPWARLKCDFDDESQATTHRWSSFFHEGP